MSDRLRTRYLEWTGTRSFVAVVDGLLLFLAAAKLLSAVLLALDGTGIHGFAEWCSVISSGVSGALIVIGAIRLPRSRIDALKWFERGLLVEILVTQVFIFQQRQLQGLVGLDRRHRRLAARAFRDAGGARAREPGRGGEGRSPGAAGGFVD